MGRQQNMHRCRPLIMTPMTMGLTSKRGTAGYNEERQDQVTLHSEFPPNERLREYLRVHQMHAVLHPAGVEPPV